MVQRSLPLAFAGGAGMPGGTSLRHLFQQTTPGFSTLQSFFSTWLNLDITTLAVALTVFGAISTGTQQLKGIAIEVYHWIVRFFTASVSIPGSDRLNREVLNWIGAKVLMKQETRILTASSEPVQSDAWEFRRAAIKRIDYHHEKRLPIQYLPTFGITWFFHDRNIFLVRRIADARTGSRNSYMSTESPDQYAVPPAGHEPLVIMCLGRSVKPIKKFLDLCRDFADKQRESFITVRASRNQYHRECWDTTILRPIRPLETVHMDKKAKDELVSDIANYLKSATRRFYTSRGIPYRRGYLLHGPPGTGKTSLSLALAGRFGLDLYILHVPTLREDAELERLFTSLPPQCIVLLEDIDAVGMKRKREPEDDDGDDKELRKHMAHLRNGRVTLSGLLNVLDGVTSQEGRIVLMTSNIADKLDEALVRPGRIDKMIFMGNIHGEAAEEMFLRMYAPDENDAPNAAETCANISPEELAGLASAFRSQVKDDLFTPAQLQGYLLNHRSHPETAVAGIREWTKSEKARMDEAKKQEMELETLRVKRRNERKQKQLAAHTAVNGAQIPLDGPSSLSGLLQDLVNSSSLGTGAVPAHTSGNNDNGASQNGASQNGTVHDAGTNDVRSVDKAWETQSSDGVSKETSETPEESLEAHATKGLPSIHELEDIVASLERSIHD
ncbi:putative P-loop containing nucleoside triphosphate hydrolase protein [Seiridium cardinale]|uniref:P-loop containing nucleoside triphosphate hydrolase protein n=1 Tax=Seiridium cardinale TaxID=138064 RepID=A0ABR2X8V2_9PEZI